MGSLGARRRVGSSVSVLRKSKGPCAQIVDTLALKWSLCRYFGAFVYTIWVHGPLGEVNGPRAQGLEFRVTWGSALLVCFPLLFGFVLTRF